MEEFYLVTAIGVADKSFIVYLFVCPNDYLISLGPASLHCIIRIV